MNYDEILHQLIIKLKMDGVELVKSADAINKDLDKLEKNTGKTQGRFKQLAAQTNQFGKEGADAFAAVRREALSYFAIITGGRGLTSFIRDTTKASVSLDNLSRQLGISRQNLLQYRYALQAVGSDGGGYEKLLTRVQDLSTSKGGRDVIRDFYQQTGVNLINRDNSVKRDILDQLHNSSVFQNRARSVQSGILEKFGFNADILNLVDSPRYKSIVNSPEFQGVGQSDALIQQSRQLLEDWIKFQAESSKIFNRVYSDIQPVADGIVRGLTAIERSNPREIATGLEVLAGAIVVLGTAALGSQLLKLGKLGKTPAGSILGATETVAGNTPIGRVALGAYGGIKLYDNREKIKAALKPYDVVTSTLAKGGLGFFPIAGILAQIQKESGFDPHLAPPNGEHAYGLLQWHPERQADFKRVFGHDIRESTLEEQAEFILWERKHTEKAAFKAIEHARSAREAGAAASLYYVRPFAKEREARERADLAEQISANLNASTRNSAQTNHFNVTLGDINVTSHAANPAHVANEVNASTSGHLKATLDEFRKSLVQQNAGGIY